nr:alanine dehydrogenase [Gammaproteobacteria bacterium]NIR98092.1 alanine dehydrogenase [Gammaproteobacteria bacterium]NIT63782.1 alanine dehydrogenase [Gammaproteobacteria bacterium]NIV20733.1 alanine dehydrogenase [Gammaproteobacteria bacterium]NIY32362.1 alanine dehydrogenase [Gammaproteobacteria bacterium]
MRIGIPKEIKVLEGRVALIPDACAHLVRHGHEVYVQSGAGELSGFPDGQYRELGVQVVDGAAALYEAAELVVKVKEPQPAELELLRSDHTLFCYLHLAALPDLARGLQDIGLLAIAFETVAEDGVLPLLRPMSDIAGRLAVQIGTHLLHQPHGGRGILLGGLPAAPRGDVVVIGAGSAGGNAAALAAAMGADVTVFDRKWEKLEHMRALGANVTALYPYHHTIDRAVRNADLLVGAVLVPGARAPRVITREMMQSMKTGSVLVDISVDQGGCAETTRPTTYEAPTYVEEGVTHFAVTN